MRFCPWLLLLAISASSCKPQRNELKKQLQLTTAPPAALVGAGELNPGQPDLLVLTAKRLLGLNPDNGDRHDHIGLTNVAALFGYDLTENNCGGPWLSLQPTAAEPGVLRLTSDHRRGNGPGCGEAVEAAAVVYAFKHWQVRAENVQGVAAQAGEPAPDAPPFSGHSNASPQAAPVYSSNMQGQRQWVTKETVTATGDGPTTLQLSYERLLPTSTPPVPIGPRTHGLGLYAEAASEAGHPPQLIVRGEARGTMRPVSCKAQVQVPAGCHYQAVISAHVVQSQSPYRADLQLIPRVVGLKGRLGSQPPCHYKPLRRVDGSCGGAMGADQQGVQVWFGQAGSGFDFAQDMAAQASARSSDSGGDWDFNALRLVPGQEHQGIPNIDWALRYFASYAYGQTPVEFALTSEQVRSCDLTIEAGSGPSCKGQEPRPIEPVLGQPL